jgi:hypothetical protein
MSWCSHRPSPLSILPMRPQLRVPLVDGDELQEDIGYGEDEDGFYHAAAPRSSS